MRPTESWLPIAHGLGFSSEEDMLKHLYVVQGFSLQGIGKMLGYSPTAVGARLRSYGLALRGRGGANNRGGSKLRRVSDAELFTAPVQHIAAVYGVHICTVFNERRRRRALLPDNANAGDASIWGPNEVSHGAGAVPRK